MLLAKRILGRSQLAVHPLGLAGYNVKEGDVRTAFEAGVNYFFFYDLSVRGMVEGLKTILRENRDEVVVGCGTEERESSAVRRAFDQTRQALDAAVIDIYHLLYVNPHDSLSGLLSPDGALHRINALKEEGVVRLTAVSVHNRRMAVDLIESGTVDLVMTRYNMAHRGAEESVFPAALRAGVPIVAFTATRWGSLLTDHAGMPGGSSVPTALDCYRFVLQHPAVTVVLTAPSSRKELEENLHLLYEPIELSVEEMTTMRAFGDLVYGDGRSSFETEWP
jgi:aryl-alcohol dehydrogenase-like predicted oxidoreductase